MKSKTPPKPALAYKAAKRHLDLTEGWPTRPAGWDAETPRVMKNRPRTRGK